MTAIYLICLVVGLFFTVVIFLAEANRPIPSPKIPRSLIASVIAFLIGLVMTVWTFVDWVSGFFS